MLPEKAIKQNWHERGYSFGTMQDRPGQQWNDFTHAVDELVCLLSGELTVTIAGKETQLSIGEEAFIPANTVHSVANNGVTNNIWAFGYKNR